MAPSKDSSGIFTTPPTQPKDAKPGSLTEEEVQQYFEKGYLIVKDLFGPEELQPAIEAVEELVDAMANRLYDGGKIEDKHENASFYERLTLLEKEWKGCPIMLHKRGYLPEGFKYIWSHPKLLNIVEQLIGPNISGHPVWNLRTKTPNNVEATVPWHQDNAYLDEGGDGILIPTAWIPLIDANLTNGCMVVASGGHKKGITAKHTCCAGPTWYVQLDEEEMKNTLDIDLEEDSVICEVPFGGVLFINNVIPHKSLMNKSNKIRWSLDLRWNRTEDNNCFYGIKESIPMRKENVTDFEIDWKSFETAEKQCEIEEQYLEEARMKEEMDPFEKDTRVAGPWMTRWEIIHHNKHTEGIESGGNFPITKP